MRGTWHLGWPNQQQMSAKLVRAFHLHVAYTGLLEAPPVVCLTTRTNRMDASMYILTR